MDDSRRQEAEGEGGLCEPGPEHIGATQDRPPNSESSLWGGGDGGSGARSTNT